MRGEIIGFFIIKLTNNEASTVLCSVVKHKQSTQEVGKNTRLRLVFSLTLQSCSTACCVLYNRTEHSRGFFLYAFTEQSVSKD